MFCNKVAKPYFCHMLRKFNWDALGVSASLACAIHCAVLPLLYTSLPFMGIDFIANKAFEYGMIALAFVVGVIALSHGFRKHHHRFYPIGFFTVGFIFLISKELFLDLHLILLVVAISFILLAHYFNYRLCQAHDHAHADDCDH